MSYSITRYHDISAGHRVAGHENKCADLHGHNYRFHFTCTADTLDVLGRVVDFSVVKSTLCQWLEGNWDHKFLLWEEDPLWTSGEMFNSYSSSFGIVTVPFNPTAENMAQYLVDHIGPQLLGGTGVTLVKVVVDETRKCSATYEKGEAR